MSYIDKDMSDRVHISGRYMYYEDYTNITTAMPELPTHSVYRVTVSGNTQVDVYTDNKCIIHMRIQDLEQDVAYKIPCYMITISNSGTLLTTMCKDFLELRSRLVPKHDEYYTSTIYNNGCVVDTLHTSNYHILVPESEDSEVLIDRRIDYTTDTSIPTVRNNKIRQLRLIVDKKECEYDFYDLEIPYLCKELFLDEHVLQTSLVFCLGKCILVPLLVERKAR